ncbi:MAG: hypothetical protein KDA84_15335 [Planctomycetaceae bacterium]|nr:hypothetical protein [Planctomycetaceae bacterium]
MLDSRFIAYLPIATTFVAVIFFVALLRRYFLKHSGVHLLWWAAGVLTYGTGTALESLITILGNSVLLNKLWYVMGALLGAYPLAQGTVYLLIARRTANRLMVLTLPLVLGLAVLVLLSPVEMDRFQPNEPSGKILGWVWLRWMTPLINLYAAGFLVGGAVVSSWKYFAEGTFKHRAVGNALIATGAILPGIGGAAAKTGSVQLLYVTEFIGLILIWLGYIFCLRESPVIVPSPEVISASDR